MQGTYTYPSCDWYNEVTYTSYFTHANQVACSHTERKFVVSLARLFWQFELYSKSCLLPIVSRMCVCILSTVTPLHGTV